jgi:hypothetical protein
MAVGLEFDVDGLYHMEHGQPQSDIAFIEQTLDNQQRLRGGRIETQNNHTVDSFTAAHGASLWERIGGGRTG